MYEDDIVRVIALVIMLISLCAFGISVFQFIKSQDELSKEQYVEKIDLYTINTGNMLSGSFMLGYGCIKETYYYCCYRILEDGGKTIYKFEMEKTTIYETLESEEQAYVEVVKNGLGRVISYNLYVPQNSIIKEVDLSIPQ